MQRQEPTRRISSAPMESCALIWRRKTTTSMAKEMRRRLKTSWRMALCHPVHCYQMVSLALQLGNDFWLLSLEPRRGATNVADTRTRYLYSCLPLRRRYASFCRRSIICAFHLAAFQSHFEIIREVTSHHVLPSFCGIADRTY